MTSSMRIALILAAFAAAGCGPNPTPETMMKLDLETRVARNGNEVNVTASLRNTGMEPAKVLLEFMMHRTFAILKDEKGVEIPPSRNAAATRGARLFEKPLKVQVLRPGETVDVEVLVLLRSPKSVLCGDLTWEPEDLRSDVLTAELGYEVVQAFADEARHLDEPDIAVGRWIARPVSLKFRP
jgi:hypothetical protein